MINCQSNDAHTHQCYRSYKEMDGTVWNRVTKEKEECGLSLEGCR